MAKSRVISVVKHSTMSVEMEKQAILVAIDALSKHTVEQHAARYIKETFDKEYGAQWHAVVGKQFGCFVSHFSDDFIYFYGKNFIGIQLHKVSVNAIGN